MKIRYKRRILRWNFIFGIFWLILGVIAISNNSDNYLNFGYLIAALFYLINYALKSKNQYVGFENGMITLYHLIPKTLLIQDLKKIKKIGGNYILESDEFELKIETNVIEKNSLKDLKTILKNLKSDLNK